MLRQTFRRVFVGYVISLSGLLFVIALSNAETDHLPYYLYRLPVSGAYYPSNFDDEIYDRVNEILMPEFGVEVTWTDEGDTNLALVSLYGTDAQGTPQATIDPGWWFGRSFQHPMWEKLYRISPLLNVRFDMIYAYDYPGQIRDKKVMVDLVVGLGLFNLDRCDAASRFFKRALVRSGFEDKANFAYINFYLGTCEIAAGNLQRALHYYELAYDYWDVKANHMGVGLVYNLVWLYIQLDQEQAARDLLTLFDSPDEYLVGQRIQLFAELGDADTALTLVNAAIRDMDVNHYHQEYTRREELARLFGIRGNINLSLERWTEAYEDYTASVLFDAGNPEVHYQRGLIIYKKLADGRGALKDFEHYLNLEPDGIYAAEVETYIAEITGEDHLYIFYETMDPRTWEESPMDEMPFLNALTEQFEMEGIPLKILRIHGIPRKRFIRVKHTLARIHFFPVYEETSGKDKVPKDTDIRIDYRVQPDADVLSASLTPEISQLYASHGNAQDLTIGILFYAANRCDLARPYFETSYQQAQEDSIRESIHQFQDACGHKRSD